MRLFMIGHYSKGKTTLLRFLTAITPSNNFDSRTSRIGSSLDASTRNQASNGAVPNLVIVTYERSVVHKKGSTCSVWKKKGVLPGHAHLFQTMLKHWFKSILHVTPFGLNNSSDHCIIMTMDANEVTSL